MKNEIAGWEKKVSALQQKIQLLLEENRKKDSFIQNFMMGKKLKGQDKELVTSFIKEYGIAMESKDITEKLQIEHAQIEELEKYNKTLIKEISNMRQRILMYEVIDDEKVSLYDSKCSQ